MIFKISNYALKQKQKSTIYSSLTICIAPFSWRNHLKDEDGILIRLVFKKKLASKVIAMAYST